jgi:phosphoribosylformimino-5-aminoimidazole carboxamide ribotide isomerase
MFEDAGVACIIYTDISKDGAMQGADFEGTQELVQSVNIPVILSGGISSKDDLKKAKADKRFIWCYFRQSYLRKSLYG